MSPTLGPRRAPAAATRPAAAPVPSDWSVLNPVDDDEDQGDAPPPPPAPRRARRAAAPAATAPAGKPAPVRPATRQPGPAARAEAAVGAGAPRTAQTGKPRVNWQEYDAQVYDTPPEWVLYRCWTRVPLDRRWYVRLLARLLIFLIGRRHGLLWIGISMRAGIARAAEHLADKPWRRLIHVFEIDPDVSFATEAEAEAYETARIMAECPRFNKRDNDRVTNGNATHLTKRIKAHHLADWHQQAGQLALLWLAVAAVCTWWLWPDTMPTGFGPRMDAGFRAVLVGVAAGAVIMTFGRIMRLAILGAQPTTVQRQRIMARGVGRRR